MAKDKATCPECGGKKRGRGFAHADNCPTIADKPKRAGKPKGDIVDAIDGRTKISTLLRLQAKIETLLGNADKGEVKKVKEALANVEKLREQLAEAEQLIA